MVSLVLAIALRIYGFNGYPDFEWDIQQDSAGIFIEFKNNTEFPVVICDPRCPQIGNFKLYNGHTEIASGIIKMDPECPQFLWVVNKHSSLRFEVPNLYKMYSVSSGLYNLVYEFNSEIVMVTECKSVQKKIKTEPRQIRLY